MSATQWSTQHPPIEPIAPLYIPPKTSMAITGLLRDIQLINNASGARESHFRTISKWRAGEFFRQRL
jgi:hypothetical protein